MHKQELLTYPAKRICSKGPNKWMSFLYLIAALNLTTLSAITFYLAIYTVCAYIGPCSSVPYICLYSYLSVCLSVYQSIHLSIHLSVTISVSISISLDEDEYSIYRCLYLYNPLCVSISISISLSLSLSQSCSISIYLYPSLSLSTSISLYLSIYLSI